MKLFKLILLGTLLLCLNSCQKKLGIKAYQNWFNQSGDLLSQSVYQKGFLFKLQHLPAEAIALKEYTNGIIEKENLKNRIADLQNTLQFKLTATPQNHKQALTAFGVNSQEEYSQRMDFLSYKLKDYVEIKNHNTSIQNINLHFVDNHNLNSETTFLLQIDKMDLQDGMELTLAASDEIPITISLPINYSNLQNLPQLKL